MMAPRACFCWSIMMAAACAPAPVSSKFVSLAVWEEQQQQRQEDRHETPSWQRVLQEGLSDTSSASQLQQQAAAPPSVQRKRHLRQRRRAHSEPANNDDKTDDEEEEYSNAKYDDNDETGRNMLSGATDRIAHGFHVALHDYPYFARMMGMDSWGRAVYRPTCGGALIAPQWVMTSSHCIIDKNTGKPRVGIYGFDIGHYCSSEGERQGYLTQEETDHGASSSSNCGRGHVLAKAREFFVPEEYNAARFYLHDVAIVLLEEPVLDVLYAAPDKGAVIESLRPSISRLRPMGIGLDESESMSDRLTATDLRYISSQQCEQQWGVPRGTFPVSKLFCLSIAEGSMSCSGDSGGPVIPTGAGSAVVVGVVTGGHNAATCADRTKPALFGRVSTFYPDFENLICREYADNGMAPHLPRWCPNAKPVVVPIVVKPVTPSTVQPNNNNSNNSNSANGSSTSSSSSSPSDIEDVITKLKDDEEEEEEDDDDEEEKQEVEAEESSTSPTTPGTAVANPRSFGTDLPKPAAPATTTENNKTDELCTKEELEQWFRVPREGGEDKVRKCQWLLKRRHKDQKMDQSRAYMYCDLPGSDAHIACRRICQHACTASDDYDDDDDDEDDEDES